MPRKIKVLLVEDNEDERLFMKEGFSQSGLYEIVGEAETKAMQKNGRLRYFTKPDTFWIRCLQQ